ncbi:MAG TPA: DUF1302 family protein [Myxococcota bacterium]|jgi:hypothetical protein|nr:DUF1302 family protein [Myxococcota bacterium]
MRAPVPTTRMTILVLALAVVSTTEATARTFQVGEVEGTANLELSYGLLARVEHRDGDLVAIANGGSAASANWDDGDLNYGQGIVSNAVQADLELAARWRFLGAYVRGIGFYDFATELASRARTDLFSNADAYVGRTLALPEYYLEASFRAAGMPVHVRLGKQVLNWGESTFLRFGVETVTPLDLAAGFRAASAPRDFEIPQGMLWASANVTEVLAVEAFYQYDWQQVRTSPVGWYFSDNDAIGSGGVNAAMLGSGLFSDQGTDLDAAFQLPAGTLGFDRDFMRVPGRGSHPPSSQGQCGFTAQLILPSLNSTKLAFHFLNYHGRLPIVSARAADATAAAATSPAAVAARAASLAPIYAGEGLPPAQAAAAAARAASTLTIGEYASEASYSAVYPENIQMVGVSFNTATLRTGTLLSGEVAHHFGFPFQILLADVFNAALSPIEFDPAFGQGPRGRLSPGQAVSGVKRLDKTQVELGLRQLLGPRFGASQTILGTDFGYVHVYDMPGRNHLRLSAPGVTGPSDFDHLPDADSWGYRLLAALNYENVFGAFSVQPYVVWFHDVTGTTPTPGGAFVAGRKAFNVGVSVDYTNTWLLQASYTNLFGADRFNLLHDRDFVRLQLTYFY